MRTATKIRQWFTHCVHFAKFSRDQFYLGLLHVQEEGQQRPHDHWHRQITRVFCPAEQVETNIRRTATNGLVRKSVVAHNPLPSHTQVLQLQVCIPRYTMCGSPQTRVIAIYVCSHWLVLTESLVTAQSISTPLWISALTTSYSPRVAAW